MVYAQPWTRPGEVDAQTSLGFWDTNRSPNISQMTKPNDIQQKKKKKKEKKRKRICWIVDFAVLVAYRVKI